MKVWRVTSFKTEELKVEKETECFFITKEGFKIAKKSKYHKICKDKKEIAEYLDYFIQKIENNIEYEKREIEELKERKNKLNFDIG